MRGTRLVLLDGVQPVLEVQTWQDWGQLGPSVPLQASPTRASLPTAGCMTEAGKEGPPHGVLAVGAALLQAPLTLPP